MLAHISQTTYWYQNVKVVQFSSYFYYKIKFNIILSILILSSHEQVEYIKFGAQDMLHMQ